jgi:hypothetical protein
MFQINVVDPNEMEFNGMCHTFSMVTGFRETYSVVGIATGYGLDDRGVGV